jgi:hypothetical protein
MGDMGNYMRFQALRVIDDSTVEYSFITDDQQTVQHVFSSPAAPGSIRVINGDEAWIDAYGGVPGPPIWFRRRWPYGLAGLALEASRQALPIGLALADITGESRQRLKEEWESGGHNLDSESVLLRLTHEQALVLDAFLARGQAAGDDYSSFEDQAELRVIWDIAAELESGLPVVNNEEYVEQLAAARAKVRDSTE